MALGGEGQIPTLTSRMAWFCLHSILPHTKLPFALFALGTFSLADAHCVPFRYLDSAYAVLSPCNVLSPPHLDHSQPPSRLSELLSPASPPAHIRWPLNICWWGDLIALASPDGLLVTEV